MSATTCLNCKTGLEPGHQFCYYCGQSVKTHRISFTSFFHDLVHGFTHADIGILYTIKMLAIKPGLVGREYLEGKRKKYFPPINLYLILVGLFVFALGFFHTFDQPNNYAQWRAEIQRMPDSLKQVKDRRLKKIDRAETAMAFMTKQSNLVSLLIATPLTAFVFFLFYRKSRYNYFEHLAVNLYFAGFGSLFFIFLVAPLISLVNNSTFYLAAIAFFLLAETLYRSVAYYQFINNKGIKYYLFALMASATAVVLWMFLSRTAITYYIEHGLPQIL